MQLIYICKLFLLSLISGINCYLEEEVRLQNWRPDEEIKFYPRRNEKSILNYNKDQLDKLNTNLPNDLELINKNDLNNNDIYKLHKKLHDIVQDNNLYNDNLNKIMILTNHTKNDDLNNQNLIWFLINKIIPTTNKLNQFLCQTNQTNGNLCTSFNHLHLLIGTTNGKTKRNNDDIYRKIKLIENLSNEFNNKFSKRVLNRKVDRRFNDNYLDNLINSKSIYKHHQRLKRSINNLITQLDNNQTLNEHSLIKRNLDNLDNELNTDIQHFDCYQQNKVACPQSDFRNRIICIDVTSICDGKQDCPLAEDETRHYCMFYFTLKIYLDTLSDAYLKIIRIVNQNSKLINKFLENKYIN